MRKDAQAVLLLLVGGTLFKISLTGTYVRYVKPGVLPLLLIAGAVLVAVAAITLWQVLRVPSGQRVGVPAATGPGGDGTGAGGTAAVVGTAADAPDAATAQGNPQTDPPADGDEPRRGHSHEESRVGWLLLAPALALLLFSPPALGSFQASRNGTALSSRAESEFTPLPEGDPVRITLLDYASRAVFDEGRSLTGRRITLSGFVIAGPNGQPYLARMLVSCCAADARPVKIGLTGEVPSELTPDEWIEVVGTYTARIDRDPVNQDMIPYVQVLTSRDIAPPDQQYE